MKSFEKKSINMLAAILFVSLIIFSGCSVKETSAGINIDEAERIIRMDAEGDVIHYEETLFWDEEAFSEILEDESRFLVTSKNEFSDTFGADADNFDVELVEDNNSAVFSCDIHEKFNGERYDFLWFLNPLGLDFIDSSFSRSEKQLSWGGVLEGKKTVIVLSFSFSIDNCHAHVWENE